jgi:hypothetical protein
MKKKTVAKETETEQIELLKIKAKTVNDSVSFIGDRILEIVEKLEGCENELSLPGDEYEKYIYNLEKQLNDLIRKKDRDLAEMDKTEKEVNQFLIRRAAEQNKNAQKK